MSESQLHSDDYAATGAVDGEEADVTDETSSSADEPAEADALVSETARALRRSLPRTARAPKRSLPRRPTRSLPSEIDAVAEFNRELRMLPGDWYVMHSYAGYENRVKTNLESRITSLNMEDYIFQIEVPTHQVTEIKSGKKQTVNEKVLPGYILVRMDLTDESWAVVRNTPGVTGFVGLSSKPVAAAARRGGHAARAGPRRGNPARRRRPPRRRLRNTKSASRLPLWTARSRRSRDRERGQLGHAEAQGARVDLRPGDARRAVV